MVGSFYVSCGKCWFCRRGINQKCLGIRVFGMGMAMGDLPGRPVRSTCACRRPT